MASQELEICQQCKQQPRLLLELEHQGRPALFCRHAGVLLLRKDTGEGGNGLYQMADQRYRLFLFSDEDLQRQRESAKRTYTIVRH